MLESKGVGAYYFVSLSVSLLLLLFIQHLDTRYRSLTVSGTCFDSSTLLGAQNPVTTSLKVRRRRRLSAAAAVVQSSLDGHGQPWQDSSLVRHGSLNTRAPHSPLLVSTPASDMMHSIVARL